MAYGKLVLTYYDYGGERSTVTVPTVSSDETTLAATDAAYDTIKSAVEALMVSPGTPVDTRVYSVEDVSADSASALNQRETKLLVIGKTDTSGKIRRIELPGFDLTQLNPTNKGEVDITSGPGQTLKSTLDANWIDPPTGESITVIQMRHVGRNI